MVSGVRVRVRFRFDGGVAVLLLLLGRSVLEVDAAAGGALGDLPRVVLVGPGVRG